MANKLIITVDDAPAIRSLVKMALSTEGYRVEEAGDGEEGLAVARAHQADLIITDLNMPKMNGLELVRALRRLPEYKSTPILLLTTEDKRELRLQAREARATGWIVKPFKTNELLTIVKKILP